MAGASSSLRRNAIGQVGTGLGTVISGNTGDGVLISGATTDAYATTPNATISSVGTPTVQSGIVVPAWDPVADLDVAVNIGHAADGELSISLTSPTDTTIDLRLVTVEPATTTSRPYSTMRQRPR